MLMLVPTTILAQQHWNTFRERYRDFPLRVEMVSRFRRPADVKAVLRDFAEGKVDVLIGTHRVLSRDVIPKNLGLVIVDEEQRFGVAQKELLRSLRLEVDVLALTATPIPRTLHMSLVGAARHLGDRDAARGPPADPHVRRASTTRSSSAPPSSASSRAADRPSTSTTASRRSTRRRRSSPQLVPGLRVLVGHGQMAERELEQRMLSFLRGDADVLVSTTIIESGLDIPQANTLDRRARGHARARPALPDPRARRPLRRPGPRVPLLPRRAGADAGGARPAGDAGRPHGARRRLRDRDARPRDPRRRRPPRRRAVRARRRARVRALRRDAARGRRGALGPAPAGRAAGSGRRPRRRLRPGRLHRVGGAEDRPAPPARARRRTRTSCASSSGDRGPVRPATRAGRRTCSRSRWRS